MIYTGVLMTVSDLIPGSTYAFSLSAGNAVGYGPAVKFRVTTLTQQPIPRHRLTDTGNITSLASTVTNDFSCCLKELFH